jgi:CRP-like cAMP-binding protein
VALADSLDTGDIVLFSRPCTRMGIFGGFLCFSTKLFHDTPWDHIGVVVRDAAGVNQLWDAGFNGVQHYDLRERLLRSSADEIAVRRLQCSRDDNSFRGVARAYMRDEIDNRPYKVSNLQLMRVAVDFHPSKNERRQLYYELLCAEDAARELHAHLHEQQQHQQQRVSALQQLLLQQRLRTVTAAAAQLRTILSSTDRSALENSSDHDSLFCSELVAALYQKLGLLDAVYPSSNEFLPSDFASEHQINRVLLRKGAKLHTEQFIRSADKRKLWHSAATATVTDTNSSSSDGTGTSSNDTTRSVIADTSAVQAVITTDIEHSDHHLQTQKMSAAAVNTIMQSLKRHPILSQLSDNTLTAVAQQFTPKLYKPEQCIATSSDTDSDCVVIFESGTADLHTESVDSSSTSAPKSTIINTDTSDSNNSSGNSSRADLNINPSTIDSGKSSSSSSADGVITYGAHNCFDTALTVSLSSRSTRSKLQQQHRQWHLTAIEPVKCYIISKSVLKSVCKHDAAAVKVLNIYKPSQHSSADAQMLAVVLEQHPLFMQLPLHEQQQLSKHFHPLHFAYGDYITQSNKFGDSVYVLARGEAHRTVHGTNSSSTTDNNSTTTAVANDAYNSNSSGSSSSKEQYTVIKPGACFGEATLNTMQDSTVKSTSNDCKVLALSKYDLAQAVPVPASSLLKTAFDACASVTSGSSGEKLMTVPDFMSLLQLQQQSTDTPIPITTRGSNKLFRAVSATISSNSSDNKDSVLGISYQQFLRLDMLLASPTAHVSTCQ